MSTDAVTSPAPDGESFSTEQIDHKRRWLLIGGTAAVGAVGAAFTAVPFIAAMQPSAKAQAAGAPVEVDISKVEPGQMLRVEWRGKPVWIVRRTDDNIKAVEGSSEGLRDPNSNEPQQPGYAKNSLRSIKPEYLILVGICTHLGCSPTYIKKDDQHALGADWQGGFFCPCHGSRFDLAGRVVEGVPAPTNLVVPPHQYITDTRVLIGADQGVA